MTTSFIIAFFWGITVLASLLGWGWLLMFVLRFSKKADLGWQGSFGLCFSVIVGGVLNLAGQISKTLILVYIAAVFFCFFFL